MKKILFVPIDNRPITYSLTSLITDVNKSLNLMMPERNFLGDLTKQANTGEILKWLEDKSCDLMVLSLDTISYGGLVSSRRCNNTYKEIKSKVLKLKEILKKKKEENPNLEIFATSSIMRISNNNVNEEEKEYWSLWGEKIFKYSFETHKKGFSEVQIPKEILDDYLKTRERNFEINKLYLEFLKEGILDFIVYSKDDTGEFGLNVMEANELSDKIKKENLPAIIKTGADEIPLGLLLRGIAKNEHLKIKINYANQNSTGKISRYEDISVKNCAEAQINLGLPSAKIVEANPDIELFVNNFDDIQGELVFQEHINSNKNPLPDFKAPFIIADINNANGSDNSLIENILKKGLSYNFLSYSGYNTSANTIGSALCFGVITYLAKKENKFNEKAFKKLFAIRLLDDWGYQANLRLDIQKKEKTLKELDFSYYENKIKKFINADFSFSYLLPWDRSFEIEVNLNID